MRQHRFDKNFQLIVEAVQNVYNEVMSDEEMEEYFSNFSEAELDELVQNA